jgi:hypothetical protein
VIDEGGGIRAMRQQAAPDYKVREIPIERALLVRAESEKSNPEGRSILRCTGRWGARPAPRTRVRGRRRGRSIASGKIQAQLAKGPEDFKVMLLLRVEPQGGDPFTHEAAGDSLVVGRSSKADLKVQDPFMSRLHARFFREGDRWLVEDLGGAIQRSSTAVASASQLGSFAVTW